jgi:hypothetical protein
MPLKPTTRPIVRRMVSGTRGSATASKPTIQNGDIATRTAVSPLATVSSAHTTPPLPKPSINAPRRASGGHARTGGNGWRLTSIAAIMSTPEIE